MRNVIAILILAAAPLAAQEQVKVYKARHRPAEGLVRVLGPMTAEVRADFSRDFNTITMRGTEQGVKNAQAILEQYDTPRRQAEFVLRVIEASSVASKANDAEDLVPAELKSLLRYTRYGLRDVAIIRGAEAEQLRLTLAGGMGGMLNFRSVREGQPPQIELDIRLHGSGGTLVKRSGGAEEIQRPELLATTATLKSGETVVLGVSKMIESGSALIVLLTAKLLP